MQSKEKFRKAGILSLSDVELIDLIICDESSDKDAQKSARIIAEKFGENYENITYEDLMKTECIDEISALRIASAVELLKRSYSKENKKISSSKDVSELVNDIRQRRQEHFVTITLNGAGYLIHKRIVFIGTLNKSLVHPREIFADAITDRASGIIFVHNHPSGEIEPSHEDIIVTERLVEAGRILGIEVLDHVIVSKKNHYSFKENGKI